MLPGEHAGEKETMKGKMLIKRGNKENELVVKKERKKWIRGWGGCSDGGRKTHVIYFLSKQRKRQT